MAGATWVTHDELAEIWEILRGIKSVDADLLTIHHGPDGITFDLQENEIAQLVGNRLGLSTIVQVTGGGPGRDWTGNVHANGPDEAATHTGVPIRCFPDVAATMTGIVNHWFIAVQVPADVTMSSSSSASSASTESESSGPEPSSSSSSQTEESSSSSGDDFVYYIQAPIWL